MSLDPEERPSSEDALCHDWVSGKTATTATLLAAPLAIRKKLALAKFRKAVQRVMVTNRFKLMFSAKKCATRVIRPPGAAAGGGSVARTRSAARMRIGTNVHGNALDATDLRRFRVRRRFRRIILVALTCVRMHRAIERTRSGHGVPSSPNATGLLASGVAWLTGTDGRLIAPTVSSP